ncbi:SRPBCC family protein [Confluentibacter lentus]|uniref:SRPBCC family protein n=1 Tax=Confluentibacter lentus TaxID=1699412 RepID=UPI000C283E41|nr:SRPBCC domain-containing protein [Confluentibacter lentus]
METKNFSYSFESTKSPETIFTLLLDVKKWWSGFYEETIIGESKKPNDVFSFKAGGGMHYTVQKLVEVIPNKKIVWLVTESNLSFLKEVDEWNNTKIRFDLLPNGNKTKITFTHDGLVPAFECYGACSSAWTNYMQQLENTLR